jgi:hypothetical protein
LEGDERRRKGSKKRKWLPLVEYHYDDDDKDEEAELAMQR